MLDIGRRPEEATGFRLEVPETHGSSAPEQKSLPIPPPRQKPAASPATIP